MTLEELTREYRGIVERIPDYIIEAAKGRIRVNGIKGSIAKRMLLIQNGKPADTIMEKWGWRAGTPLGRNGMGIPIPIEIGETYRNKKKITRNTIGKKRRAERNGKKIPFIPDWAHRKHEGNDTGKYITVAIEEEDKTTIGFMREHRPKNSVTSHRLIYSPHLCCHCMHVASSMRHRRCPSSSTDLRLSRRRSRII